MLGLFAAGQALAFAHLREAFFFPAIHRHRRTTIVMGRTAIVGRLRTGARSLGLRPCGPATVVTTRLLVGACASRVLRPLA